MAKADGLVSESFLAVLQAEEGAAAGPAMADNDERGAAARSSAQRLDRGWLAVHPSSSQGSVFSTTVPLICQPPQAGDLLPSSQHKFSLSPY